MRRLVSDLLIVVMLICTANGMLRTWSIRFDSGSYIQNRYLSNLFYIYGVFLEVHHTEREFKLCGLSAGGRERTARSSTICTDIQEYFPQSHGETLQRLALKGYRAASERQRDAYATIAEVVMREYNAAHPDVQLTRGYLIRTTWPADHAGLNSRRSEAQIDTLATVQQ